MIEQFRHFHFWKQIRRVALLILIDEVLLTERILEPQRALARFFAMKDAEVLE